MDLEASIDVNAFLFSEEEVAALLTTEKGRVRAGRGPEGQRWSYGPRRQVLWSLAGAQALRADLEGPQPPVEVAPEVAEACRKAFEPKPIPEGLTVLEVMRCRFENRQIMHCVDPDEPVMGREHVGGSVSDVHKKRFHRRIPSWEEMCYVKDLFGEPEEAVMQLHPPRSQCVNECANCLHLWRPLKEHIPMPGGCMVGGMGPMQGTSL